MIKYYELYWSWYEDYVPFIFSHESKTKKQFEKDVRTMLRKYGEEYIQQEESWVSAYNWIEYIVPKMSELGYELITPHQYGQFGAYIIRNSETDGFGKKVGRRLIEIATKQNEVVERRLMKDQ
jgi:hypothetical protein